MKCVNPSTISTYAQEKLLIDKKDHEKDTGGIEQDIE